MPTPSDCAVLASGAIATTSAPTSAGDTMSLATVCTMLVSSDGKLRNKGLSALENWLPRALADINSADETMHRETIRDTTLFEPICTSLFDSYWMCDKRSNQMAMAERVAQIPMSLCSVSPRDAIAFLGQLWRVLVQRWSKIDRLRMDKYFSLLRHLHYAGFWCLSSNQWDQALVECYVDMMTGGESGTGAPLCAPRPGLPAVVPDGIYYHSAEVYLLILAASASSAGGQGAPEVAVLSLLAPFALLMISSRNNVLVERIANDVFIKFATLLKKLNASTLPRSLLNNDENNNNNKKKFKKNRYCEIEEETENDDGDSAPSIDVSAVRIRPEDLVALLFSLASRDGHMPSPNRRRMMNAARTICSIHGFSLESAVGDSLAPESTSHQQQQQQEEEEI